MNSEATPIITSLLDTDAYKLHMQQAVFHHYRSIPVVAEFRCRSSKRLGQYADELRRRVAMMAELSVSDDEYNYRPACRSFRRTTSPGSVSSVLIRHR